MAWFWIRWWQTSFPLQKILLWTEFGKHSNMLPCDDGVRKEDFQLLTQKVHKIIGWLADGLNGGSVNWDPLPVGYTVNQGVIHYWWFYFHSADDSTPILLMILLPFNWWLYSCSTDDSTPILLMILLPFYWWFYSHSTYDSTPNDESVDWE